MTSLLQQQLSRLNSAQSKADLPGMQQHRAAVPQVNGGSDGPDRLPSIDGHKRAVVSHT